MAAEIEPDGVQKYVQRGEQQRAALAARRARMRTLKFDTLAVHGLYGAVGALQNQGSVIEPAYLSTAESFENSDHLEAALANLIPTWTYARYANPTVGYLEETLALLEGYGFDGEVRACATASGMAAIFMATDPFLAHLPTDGPPANIVATARCYGGTFVLFSQRYGAERGVEVRWVKDPLDLDEWASQIDAHTRFVYGEMPSNPTLSLFDIAALAELAHRQGVPLIVDATVATPALLRPLCHGADIVVHSASKSMAAGGLVIAGALIARQGIPSPVGPDELRADFATYVKAYPFHDYGPGLSPFNALMVLSELRTLRSRMDVLSSNALRVARFLAAHPAVEAVYYPGLPGTAGHDLALRYLRLVDSADAPGGLQHRFGHLVSFTLKGGVPATRAFYDRLELVVRAADLGRIKSLATIPAISTHQQQGEAARQLAGVPGHMVRLSVGGEHPDDIIADLLTALD